MARVSDWVRSPYVFAVLAVLGCTCTHHPKVMSYTSNIIIGCEKVARFNHEVHTIVTMMGHFT